MLIAQLSPVAVSAIFAGVVLLVVCHIWVFATLYQLCRLGIRILDTLSELSIAVSRLEQAQHNRDTAAAQMHNMATGISKTLSKPGVDIDNLLRGSPNEPH